MTTPLRAGRAPFDIDIQLFAEGDDDLGAPPEIDLSSLSDDPIQLKRVIATVMSDNKRARNSDRNQRQRRITVETELASEKAAHVATKTTLETDLTKHKTDLETANRSNGQLRSKFREQFVDVRVRGELEKRGVKNVDDAMKLFDTSKLEFDEEKLEIKEADKLGETLDVWAKEREYLFDPSKAGQQQQIRGTSLGRSVSDTSGKGGGNGEIDKTLTSEAALAEILGV